MHFFAIVLVPDNTTDIEEKVAEIMLPHEEKYDEHSDEHSGFWDWYQIGGRWTGVLSNYDPREDPNNIEVCKLCNGTGRRNDKIAQQLRAKDSSYTCNGCGGKGRSAKWPTDWKSHGGDTVPLDACLNDEIRLPYALLTESEVYKKQEVWNHPDFFGWPREGGDRSKYDELTKKIDEEHDKEIRAKLESYRGKNMIAVVVDYHC